MSHFGDWMSAYVDGQLGAARAERLVMHTAQCRRCATELAAIRQARSALMSAPDVDPSSELTNRLLRAVAEQNVPADFPRRQVVPFELRPESTQDRVLPALTGEVHRPQRARRATLMVGAGVCAALLGVAALGSPSLVAPDLSDVEALTILAGGQSRDSMVQQVNRGEQDNPIMVREQSGKLATHELDAVQNMRIADRPVFVLSVEPLHIVWQSGDIVVDLVAAGQSPAVTEVIEHYPNHSFPSGVERRIARGWATLTGAN